MSDLKLNNMNGILGAVNHAIKEAGKDPALMIAGYLTQGDERYITRKENAREMIQSVQRKEIIETLVSEYLEAIDECEPETFIQNRIADMMESVSRKIAGSGDDPVVPLASYLISGDATYITSADSAREEAAQFNYNKVVHELVRYHFEEHF